MQKVEVKFGEWIQQGFDLWKANIGVLVLANLLAGLVGGLTCGVLMGPMYVGLLLVVLRIIDGDPVKPAATDVFKGFELFLQSFLCMLVLMLANVALAFIPIVGTVLAYVLMTVTAFAMFLIADQKEEFWPAITRSVETTKTNFFPFLGLIIVASLIASVGMVACGIGVIFTAPISVVIMAVAYREIFGGGGAAPEAVADAPADTPASEDVAAEPAAEEPAAEDQQA